jgi:hypothetical protein
MPHLTITEYYLLPTLARAQFGYSSAKSRQKTLEISLLSESSLQKDWLRSEEDEAWQDL